MVIKREGRVIYFQPPKKLKLNFVKQLK